MPLPKNQLLEAHGVVEAYVLPAAVHVGHRIVVRAPFSNERALNRHPMARQGGGGEGPVVGVRIGVESGGGSEADSNGYL